MLWTRVINNSNSNRKLLIIGSQIVLAAVTYYASFLLRLDFRPDATSVSVFWRTLPILIAIKLVVFTYFGLMHGWWKYAGLSDLLDITKAALTSSLVFGALVAGVNIAAFPHSVVAIDCLLTTIVFGGARVAVRAYTENVHRAVASKNTLVVGAGQAGIAIVRELKRQPDLDYDPIGFVDDNTTKCGIKFAGVEVLGTTSELPALIEKYGVSCVLIAIPGVKGREVRSIITTCRECNVEFKILPSLSDTMSDQHRGILRGVRDVRPEDLLGRQPVRIDNDVISRALCHGVVLISGAGGSIGSELARQVAGFRPRQLILYERSESDMFRISTELSTKFPKLDFVPVIGDILDAKLLREVFGLYRPDCVFHAAAYKHVPMMERNCFQAVSNNIFGTYNIAVVAKNFRTESFVLISSDKAVRPTNVMGVTKRIAELIILGLQGEGTRFTAVRFGNVLGSSGSVLPVFQEQIAKGGPITVTDPQVYRYFMTIPEAVQLVLQAATMGKGGEIFVLDMGEQIRIMDLARDLVRLSGYSPDEIEIAVTGLRPGEKLCEELALDTENIANTEHPKIRVLKTCVTKFTYIQDTLDRLAITLESKNMHRLLNELKNIVPEYTPSPDVLALCEMDRFDFAFDRRSRYAGRAAAQADVA